MFPWLQMCWVSWVLYVMTSDLQLTNVLTTAGMLVNSGTVPSLNRLSLSNGTLMKQCQLIPQIFINYRRHNATGLQPTMMMLWAWAGVPLGVYNIVEEFNVALRIQPQILTLLSLVTWIQCHYYERVKSLMSSPLNPSS